jgi:peptidoglycan/xylan/chitin deacetylase (PgdA/CDA1 family)
MMLITKVAKQLLRGVRDRRRVDSGVRILTYHGLVEQRRDPRVEASFHLIEDFRSHVRFLRRCHVIGLDELPSELARRHVRPCVTVTFDDGFRNNLIAAELLAAARLPATVFVAAENVSRGEPIWPTLLRLVLACGSARVVELGGAKYDLDRDTRAFTDVRTAIKIAPTSKRLELWAELVSQLRSGELDELIARFPSIAMMSWSDASSLVGGGFAIGSHGLFHELQHENQPRELRMRELGGSKQLIEASLGRPCTAFAFPNGTTSPEAADELQASGYELGFTMVSRAASGDADLRLLPRIVPGAGAEKLISALVFGN